jgi:type VI secretion system VasI family protein
MRQSAMICLTLFACGATAHAEWFRKEETSAIDDSRNVYFVLEAEQTTPDSLGRPQKPRMAIMCQKNETRVIFDFNDYMGNKPTYLTYRLDKSKAKQIDIDVSQDGQVLGFWRGAGITFLKEIAGARKLAVGARPYNSGMVETVFTISGIDKAIADVRSFCKW